MAHVGQKVTLETIRLALQLHRLFYLFFYAYAFSQINKHSQVHDLILHANRYY